MSGKHETVKLEGAVKAVGPGPRSGAVLVVESDPDLQWRLARLLTVSGNRVVGTSTADGALALMSAWEVDLVLVDETLHGMSGIDLARKLHDTYPHIQVVLMTADDDAQEDMHVAARLAGVVACLAKPFRPEAIAELLRLLPGPVVSPA
jgi:CheY-like chemotaxis protein